ncbi:MAG: aspartate/glutamate racemase family protein [Patescibacteria group bacterium]
MIKTKKFQRETILVADSCAGGLDVLRYFLAWAGEYELLYLADGKRNPFGLKTKEEIKEIIINWIEKFQKMFPNLVLVVIACNTASIAVLKNKKSIEQRFGIPIVTMLDGVNLSLSKNIKRISGKKVLITGTKYTINSNEYQKLLRRAEPKKLYSLCATKSEKFIARGLEKNKSFKKEVLDELSKYKNKSIETIFLGCTCFEFIKYQLKRLYGNDTFFLNPAKEVSEMAKFKLQPKEKRKKLNNVKIYTTGDLRIWKKNINLISNKIFGKKLKIKKLRI